MNRLTIASALVFLCCASVQAQDSVTVASETPAAYAFPNTVEVGDVDAETLAPAYALIRKLADDGAKTITLRIDSFGGNIFVGFKFIQMVEDVKKTHGLRIACIVHGSAYSMGAVILQSSICDLRGMTPSSTILFHNGSGGAKGTAEEMKQSAEFLESLNEAMGVLVANRIGMPYADYRARIAHSDWSMSVFGAVEFGVIDFVAFPDDIAPAALPEL